MIIRRILALLVLLTASTFSLAQNTVSGDILGTVTDPTGAAIPGATVTLVGATTGSSAKFTTSSTGEYHFSFLKPGAYKVTVTAPNFSTTTLDLSVSQGSTASGNVKLTLGQNSTVVEVGANTVPLLQTEDAELSTTFTQEQVQALPNPGGDITYYAQTAPGVVMNTGGGYGNFSVFGLPGTSNNFTVNGEQENDPFLNLNNSGPTNLLLGQNDISSVNVLTSAYGAEFGSFGGAQINEISRSGNNKFHGDASYYWNGRDLNANNWFNKQAGNGRPFSNDNQWSASVGGPIIKDKTFFFVNTEGIRFITSSTDVVYTPSPGYEASIVGNNGACSDASSSLYVNGQASQCAFVQRAFALYNSAPGHASATPTANDPDSVNFVETPKIFAKESLLTARVDQVLGAKDSAFAHFKYDNGTQPTYVDPISSVFNAVSPQPEYEGQMVETHTFSPNLINQLLITGAHYVAIFQSVNQAAATAAFPYFLAFADESFAALGGINLVFPQGRNATQYQIQDDLSWTKKNHTFKFGYAFKKDDITDFDQNTYTKTPEVVTFGNLATEQALGLAGTTFTLQGGGAYEYVQSFPPPPPPGDLLTRAPIGLYSEGFYVQDSYKATPTLLFTYGIRFEHNSNPVSTRNGFSRLNQSVASFLGSEAGPDPTTAYNTIIASNQKNAFSKFESVSYEPRIEFAYSIKPRTVLRGGFGMFSDVFPGQVADSLLGNIPQDPQFVVFGSTLDPALATSGPAVAAASNAGFKSGFAAGGSASSLSATVPGFSPPSLTTPATSVKYPTYEEYSLQLQQEFSPTMSFQVAYVGNHGYHEPVVDPSLNASSASGFAGLPTTSPSPSFGGIEQISSNASSNYNGVSVSLIRKSKIFTAQLNYTYSHAMDQISNGGFLGFNSTSSITAPLYPGTLKYNYGAADYDVRNSLNGNYIVDVPGYGGALLREVTDGWQLAGTVFYRSGLPFTVTDSAAAGDFENYSGAIPATLLNPGVSRHCSQAATTTACLGGGTSVGDVFSSDYADPTGFAIGQRNAYTGPHYFNTDVTLNKSFKLPYEGLRLILGVNAFNILNHPNFANPNSNVSASSFGFTTSTVSVPTSIYGSGLGGDASIRILQLHAKVSF